ncbi:hypothetical protein [Collimonas sp. OK607]|nr:hypothetical protein [Collimonas sp. OK607]
MVSVDERKNRYIVLRRKVSPDVLQFGSIKDQASPRYWQLGKSSDDSIK